VYILYHQPYFIVLAARVYLPSLHAPAETPAWTSSNANVVVDHPCQNTIQKMTKGASPLRS
jgi:hypothetical protein